MPLHCKLTFHFVALTGVSIHQDHFQGDAVAEAVLLPGITLWHMSIIWAG